MGDDDGIIARMFNTKALLGVVVGVGASKASSGGVALQPGSLLAKVSGLTLVQPSETQAANITSRDIVSASPESLEPHHIQMLLSLLEKNPNPSDRVQVLVTLGNAAAFSVNQDLIRELGGLHVIAGLLSDPLPEIRVQCLNALNNLSMNVRNQEQLKVYVPQVLELIEMSPVNSDLQLASLRLLTNLSVTNNHQHLMKSSITLFLSLLVVSNETLQTQVLKVLVNLSANPDMMEDIVQAQAPASLVLLFDSCTNTPVLLRLLTFVGNLQDLDALGPGRRGAAAQ
ncbi:hypothetical protein AGOR_G00185880 [Albula goreensis]|uniref:Armadillo repeat-containing domain-containing protein n=1 Tax=Albula goreensis TaxID=1534307 RepID=A0A8T3D1I7_9TELE|nr:hypothetical protein AGOR_G00185880 [Albula goreensis]